MPDSIVRTGRRGTVVIPAPLRRKLRIDEGTLLMAEESDGAIVLRPLRTRRRHTQADRDAFWAEYKASLERLEREDPEGWAALLAEDAELDAMPWDGLENEPPYPRDNLDERVADLPA
jgi:AbrB family looped-hinge helix DNA binding protein